jgi:ribonuclease HI
MEYILYTDGACQPNPGQGGWAFVLMSPDGKESYIQQGSCQNTTNNRMELSAVLYGLRFFKDIRKSESDSVKLYSDSMYLINGVSKWSFKWRINGWRKKVGGEEILNPDLWKSIREAADLVKLCCEHVPGHSGHIYNELVDKLAVEMVGKNSLFPCSQYK